MRELSDQEKVFLKNAIPEDLDSEAKTRQRKSRSRQSSFFGNKLESMFRALIDYLPLAIGFITVLVSSLAIYLYIWGRDLFKLSELERMNKEGTLSIMDSSTKSWFEDTLDIFTIAPWVILAVFIFGVLLMGLSIILIGKRKRG